MAFRDSDDDVIHSLCGDWLHANEAEGLSKNHTGSNTTKCVMQSVKVAVIARNTIGQLILKCPEPVPVQAATSLAYICVSRLEHTTCRSEAVR
eukprot:6202927-Pleurochrysis_carterae.AAC.1